MSERIRSKVVLHPTVTDGLLALLLLSMTLVICLKLAEQNPGIDAPWVIAAQAVLIALLLLRTLWPRTVLLLTSLGCAGLVYHLEGVDGPLVLAPAAAIVAVAARGDRRSTILWWGISSGLILVSGSIGAGEVFQANQIGVFVWLGFFAAVGEAVESKKAYVAAVEERARRAEHTREEEARRRVAEERLRIAQELHDVVAHHIAVIHVQASVAEHLVADQPDAAKEALTHVRRSSRTVLDELTGLLNVLRQPGDSKTPVEPAAGVADLPELIHSFESSGMRVTWAVRGARRELPPAVDLVAYRLVQEGLTNAHKHGCGSATLDVRFTGEAVSIDIMNQNGASSSSLSDGEEALIGGYGLIGMRERALAVGGSLRAAPEPDGTWRVRARLPVRAEPEPVPRPVKPVKPVRPVESATTCVADLRKLPAKLTREPAGRESGRSTAQESV